MRRLLVALGVAVAVAAAPGAAAAASVTVDLYTTPVLGSGPTNVWRVSDVFEHTGGAISATMPSSGFSGPGDFSIGLQCDNLAQNVYTLNGYSVSSTFSAGTVCWVYIWNNSTTTAPTMGGVGSATYQGSPPPTPTPAPSASPTPTPAPSEGPTDSPAPTPMPEGVQDVYLIGWSEDVQAVLDVQFMAGLAVGVIVVTLATVAALTVATRRGT